MQFEQELDNKIRGLQTGKSDKQTRNTSTKEIKRTSKSGNPNGGSESEAEPQTNRQEWSKKSGGVQAYDSPSNKEVRDYQNKQKGKGTHSKQKGGKTKSKGKGARYFFPAPDCDDPLVKMQNQMEICKNKGERRISMEVSKTWFELALQSIINDKGVTADTRVVEECTKKAFLLYIQSWLARELIGEKARETAEDTEEVKDRKAYLTKVKEMIFDLRKCEIYPMISGYQEIKIWAEDKLLFIIHGNQGCEIWFRRFLELSKTGRIWELNEEGKELRITKSEEDYNLLTRRYGRYKKARAAALTEIRHELRQVGEQDRFVGWRDIHNRVCERREETGYSSEAEENKHAEGNSGKGWKGGKKDGRNRQEQKGNGKKGQAGKMRKSPYIPSAMI